MKTVAEIKAFWSALPESAPFTHHYAHSLDVIKQTAQDARRADEAARAAKLRHRNALADLRHRVEVAAESEWTAVDIAAARGAALRCALELATMPAVGRSRHRWRSHSPHARTALG